jgi:hydroxymethylglutaryl-CoA reductase
MRSQTTPEPALSAAEIASLQRGLTLDQADHMVENVVAIYPLPFAVGTGFLINGREVRVPMVSQNLADVAACRFAAGLARTGGGFMAGSSAPIMIGQIQVLDVPDIAQARGRILASVDELLDWLNTQNPSTISRHARAVGIEVREIEAREIGESRLEMSDDSAQIPRLHSLISTLQSPISTFESPAMLIVHLLYDCGDAMGANLVNTACEALAPRVEMLTGGRVNLLILSNLSDRRRAWATCTVPVRQLAGDPRLVARRIVAVSALAEEDPYAATALNKYVMDGIDAVVIATGNDWRAVEAGAHAYAARDGRYTSLARWRLNELGDLRGDINLPLAVGIVGGATRVLPVAKAALKLLSVYTARDLAEVIACVGLAQNFAAIYTLIAEDA